MNCRKCLHFMVCTYNDKSGKGFDCSQAENCPSFRNRDNFVELPCKVGETVWLVTSPYNIAGYEFEGDGEKVKVFECVVESITFYSKGTHQVRCYCNGEFVAHYLRFCDFGKTVFLDRPSAEAKLREMEGDNNEQR